MESCYLHTFRYAGVELRRGVQSRSEGSLGNIAQNPKRAKFIGYL